MTKCEFCNTQLDVSVDTYKEKVFCNQNCLNESNEAYFNYNIEEYIEEHLEEIAQRYRKELKDIVGERY